MLPCLFIVRKHRQAKCLALLSMIPEFIQPLREYQRNRFEIIGMLQMIENKPIGSQRAGIIFCWRTVANPQMLHFGLIFKGHRCLSFWQLNGCCILYVFYGQFTQLVLIGIREWD